MRQPISGWLTIHLQMLHVLLLAGLRRDRDDRGDVPGWVMVTVMTAAVVAALIPLVDSELKALLRQAFNSVRQ